MFEYDARQKMNSRNGNGNHQPKIIRYIDLFCGIGGFRVAINQAAPAHGIEPVCVFSSDIDEDCQTAYEGNFGERPIGDIKAVNEKSVPDHDLLLGGFPCQPFSIIGHRKGFEDTRGTLFFDIARIIKEKRPKAFVLENVKLLVGHNGGRTLARIMETLREIGYQADYRVFNALKFGLPQKRERVFIVGFLKPTLFDWPIGDAPMKPLSEILEKRVPERFFASDYIRERRWNVLKPRREPTIWHENKGGNISAHPFSCALRAGASYNYLLVNGERRLTPREMLRLQGFPDSYEIICNETQTRKQAGNSVPVPVVEAVLRKVFEASIWKETNGIYNQRLSTVSGQMQLLEKHKSNANTKTTERRKIQATIRAK
jgi:DNA (cytosine-5)-methyltransferase 1